MPEPQIEIDLSPAYELILSLAVASDLWGVDTYEDVSEAPSDLVREVQAFGGGSDMVWAHLLGLAYDCPTPRNVQSFLACLHSADPMEVRLTLLGYYIRFIRHGTPPEIIEAAAQGDAAAQREFMRTSIPLDDAWQTALSVLLPLDAAETKQRLLALIHRWNDAVFREMEPRLLEILRRDVEAKHALSRDRVLEAALPGMDFIPEPGIRRVILIPSYVIRPIIHSFERGDLKFLAYPVADESVAASSDAPSPHLLRLARALGDERRLRILKRLTAGDYTLQELADHFGIGNTTLLHHLVILRGASLVRVRAQGASKRYSLRRESIERMGSMLERYLDSC